MNSETLKIEMKELETRIERASMSHHSCLAKVLEGFMSKNPNYADVSLHCIAEKNRVDTLMVELRENYL